MNCNYHLERNAVHRCDKCGNLLCQECSVVVDGRTICKACVHKVLDGREPVKPTPPPAPAHAHAYESRPVRRKPSFIISAFLALCLPGSAHMYMGLMKRGLFVMSAFFLSIFCVAITEFELLGLAIPIIYIAGCFDAFNIRKRLIAGEAVHDSASDLTGFFYRHRVPFVVFSIIIVAFGWLSRFFNVLNRYMGYPFRNGDFGFLILSAAIIGFGVYVFKRGKKVERNEHNDNFME